MFRRCIESFLRKRPKSDQSGQIHGSANGRSLQSQDPNHPQILRKRYLLRIQRKEIHTQGLHALPVESGHDQGHFSHE